AVEGAGDATAARADRLARGEEALRLVILDGARFQCQGSGACCRSYVFGPLYDDDIARLEGLDFPDLERPFVVAANGGPRLRSVGDRCIFLDADERCRIHLRYGAEAKPRICRLYPLEAHATVA